MNKTCDPDVQFFNPYLRRRSDTRICKKYEHHCNGPKLQTDSDENLLKMIESLLKMGKVIKILFKMIETLELIFMLTDFLSFLRMIESLLKMEKCAQNDKNSVQNDGNSS